MLTRTVFVLALLAAGCASGSGALRIAADTGRLICGALGCPCAASAGSLAHPGRRPIAFDVLPDGSVRPVYAEVPPHAR